MNVQFQNLSPWGGGGGEKVDNWKFQGSKTKLFKIKCETKLEFPEGCAYIVCEGSNPKKPLWEGYDIFWDNTIRLNVVIMHIQKFLYFDLLTACQLISNSAEK